MTPATSGGPGTSRPAPEGRERDIEESIWRRTQHPLNAAQSGWDGTGGRRRIVHYRNRYAAAGPHLVLTEWYLYYCLTCPPLKPAATPLRSRAGRQAAGHL